MFGTKPPNGHQPRDTKVQLHLLRLLCNLLMPQITPQTIPEQEMSSSIPNLTAEHQGRGKSFTWKSRNLKVQCSPLGKFIKTSHVPHSARAGLVHKENLSAPRLRGCRTGLFAMPQRHETDGAVLLAFKIRACSRDPTGWINPGTERASGCAQEKSNEGTWEVRAC